METTAYNPFPLFDVLTAKFGGIVKFGVGRDMAEELETITAFCDRTFFRR